MPAPDEHEGARRVALVTAAAGAGIGAAIARRLAADGFDVVITDAHERRCGAFAGQLAEEHGREFLSMPLDVTDFDAVGTVTDAVVAQRGRIDALVNNAGWSKIEPVAEMAPETWQRCLDVDLNGTFYAMRRVLPHMIAQGAGAIVNISSIAAWEMTTEHGAAYSAAKAGILALTRVAAAENGRQRHPRQCRGAGADLQRLSAPHLPRRVLRRLRGITLSGRPRRTASGHSGPGFVPDQRPRRIHHRRGVWHQRRRIPRMPDRGSESPICWPIASLIEAYREGLLSPVEVADEVLARSDRLNPSLHAYLVRFDELTRGQAREAEAAYRAGRALPLSGVPVSIKDTFPLAGAVTTFGSAVHRQNHTQHDSGVVRRLRASGAMFTGKTNTAEFGQSATSDNRLGPEACNPWDTTRTLGGSSGGAAVSVAAGLASVALAADGGGVDPHSGIVHGIARIQTHLRPLPRRRRPAGDVGFRLPGSIGTARGRRAGVHGRAFSAAG